MKESYTNRKALAERACWLRKNQTRPERRLWSRLRKKKLDGHKFRRQHILEPFIVDFYCPGCGVVVEVDGPSHGEGDAAEQDKSRDALLEEEHGVRVLRFEVIEIYQELEEVLDAIRDACRGGEDLLESEGGGEGG